IFLAWLWHAKANLPSQRQSKATPSQVVAPLTRQLHGVRAPWTAHVYSSRAVRHQPRGVYSTAVQALRLCPHPLSHNVRDGRGQAEKERRAFVRPPRGSNGCLKSHRASTRWSTR